MSPKRTPGIFEKYALPLARLTDEAARWKTERGLLRSLAATSGSRSNKWVLDLACGTGFHARHLAREGCNVTGIERSPAAIEAGRQLPGGNLVDWQVGDITRQPEGEYDLALLLGNTLSLFAEREQVAAIIRAAAAALTANGVLIIQILDYEFLRGHPVRAECRLELAEATAVFSKRIDPADHGGIITVQLAFPDSPGRNRESEKVILNAWEEQELREISRLAGLSMDATYGGMDKSPYQPGGNRDLVMVLRK